MFVNTDMLPLDRPEAGHSMAFSRLPLALLATLTAAAAEPTVSVSPALGGAFRPGAPLALRVAVAEAPAFDGWLDVVAEGIAFRQRLQVGAGGQATIEALVAVHSDQSHVDVVLRKDAGGVVFRQAVPLTLRGGERVAAVLDGDAQAGAALLGEGWTVTAGDAPATWAGFLATDAVVVLSGSALPDGVWDSLEAWVRAGGMLVLPPNTSGLRWPLAEGETKRLGLGSARAGGSTAAATRREAWVDKGVWGSFPAARWETTDRWRAAGGAVALLVAGCLLVTSAASRRGGRAKLLALAVAVSAALAFLAWAVMLPPGRGVVSALAVVESVAGQAGGRRTDVVCVSGAGRERVRVALPGVEAVVPLYYSRDEAGGWRDVVVGRERDGWFVECDVTDRVRCCFGALGGWDADAPPARGAADGDLRVRDGLCSVGRGDEWQSLRLAADLDPDDKAVLLWQARRTGRDGRLYRAAFESDDAIPCQGERLMASHRRRALAWVELRER
jgi:hypothetical protein